MTTKRPKGGLIGRLERLAEGARAQQAGGAHRAWRGRHDSRGAASDVRKVDVAEYLAEAKAKGEPR